MILHADRAAQAKTSAAFWLDRLEAAHADLLSAINDLARLMAGPAPSHDVLVSTRWSVSDASLARRRLWGQIHAYLSTVVDRNAATELRHLQDVDIQLIRASILHIGSWTTEAILDDWPGYCGASADMRSKLIEAIASEKRLLYPMLKRLARR